MTTSKNVETATYVEANSLMLRWGTASANIWRAIYEFKSVIEDYENLGKYIKQEEIEEFQNRLEIMSQGDFDRLEDILTEITDIEIPLDFDTRFPPQEYPPQKTRRYRKPKKRVPFNGETVAA